MGSRNELVSRFWRFTPWLKPHGEQKMEDEEELLDRPLVDRHEFSFDQFRFVTTKYHILESNCIKGAGQSCPPESPQICQVCRYKEALKDLPQWPEMIFPENILRIERMKPDGSSQDDACVLEFSALDALKLVDCAQPDVKVASSEEWMESRKEGTLKSVLKPFDWTFTTKYQGTARGFQISPTEERIDLEKLKVHEEILHFQELSLFEDELGDNGCSLMLLKMRCMPSGFFVLLRDQHFITFYLRVDGVMARINDTRLHWEKGKNHILREYSSRENWVKSMSAAEADNILDPNVLWNLLPVVTEECEKLTFPAL